MERPNRLLFLDFDGTIITTKCYKPGHYGLRANADPACIEQLNRILREVPDVGIVFSTSWKLQGITFCLEKLLHWGVDPTLAKVVGRTALVDYRRNAQGNMESVLISRRGEQICSFLKTWEQNHGRPKSFAILDDDTDVEPLHYHLVQTDMQDGLTAALADKAIRLLREG